jgi:hypothetical protein
MEVQVFNESKIDFEGLFKDQKIFIPAGESIPMGRAQAVKFLGEFSQPQIDGAGRHKMPKMLKMVEDPEIKAARYDQPMKYEAIDGKMFRTKQGVEKYNSEFRSDASNASKPRRRRVAKETGNPEREMEGNVNTGV